MTNWHRGLVVVLGVILATAFTEASEDAGKFLAGASKIDITPARAMKLTMSGYGGRTEPFSGIFDPLHCRAIVLDDGRTQAALVVVELSTVSNALWEEMSQRIERETGIPRGNVLLAATHTHAGPTLGRPGEQTNDDRATYTRQVCDEIVQAVREAKGRLQPALVGVGKGRANVNVCRRARMAGGAYYLGRDPDGPSDKTVHVMKLATAGGAPIAIMVNYGMHCTALGPENLKISSDVGGATARYMEKHYGGDVVAPWTSGAGGDQAPLYHKETSLEWINAMGEILGEEAIRVAKDLPMSPQMRIRTQQRTLSLPGQETVPHTMRLARDQYTFRDAEPVKLRLSLLMLNHTALCGVSAEVLTMIGQHLKAASPLAETMMITHCNGSSGYIPDDAAYDKISYEIVQTHAKPGAEGLIVNALVEMMEEN